MRRLSKVQTGSHAETSNTIFSMVTIALIAMLYLTDSAQAVISAIV